MKQPFIWLCNAKLYETQNRNEGRQHTSQPWHPSLGSQIWSPPAKRTWQCALSRPSHTPGSTETRTKTEREEEALVNFTEKTTHNKDERELNISCWFILFILFWNLHRDKKKRKTWASPIRSLTHCFDNSWRLTSVQTCYERFWNIQIRWAFCEENNRKKKKRKFKRESSMCVCMWARVYNNRNQ